MEVVFDDLRRLPPKIVGEADLGGRLPYLGPMGLCVFTHSIRGEWNVPGKYGPHGELFFLPDSRGAGDGAGDLQPLLPC